MTSQKSAKDIINYKNELNIKDGIFVSFQKKDIFDLTEYTTDVTKQILKEAKANGKKVKLDNDLSFKDRVFIDLEHGTKEKKGMPNNALKNIIDNIDKVGNGFHFAGGNGIPQIKTISGTDFEEWRSSVQFEMRQIKQDEFVLKILELTDNFNGWNDESVFAELCSKLKILCENSDKYYSILERKEDLVLDRKKVFVIHGRNEKIRKSMFAFLRSIGLDPIEWDEAKRMTGKPTPYTGEILDIVFTNAQTVIVLMTPDDEAKLKYEFIQKSDKDYEKNLTPQARANVIYEAGMAMGRCPNRTILVEFGNDLRPYSDVGGLNVIKMTDTPEKRSSLVSAIRTSGADVGDITSKTDWLSTGDFSI